MVARTRGFRFKYNKESGVRRLGGLAACSLLKFCHNWFWRKMEGL